MTFFSDRYLGYVSFYDDKPIMDNYKYGAIKFISENTNEDSKILISIPFSFPTFFHREYSYITNTTNIEDYNYIISFRNNSTFIGQIIYENQELKIIKISN
jgi:hypothetical protein